LQGWASVLVAAAFSGLASYSNSGGDLGQALLSAGITFASAVFSAGIGEAFGHSVEFFTAAHAAKTVAHGVVGGVISKFQGGNFQSGFLSSAVGALAAPAIGNIYKGVKTASAIAARTAVAAVAGGVGAVLGGGKFINGAATTAMQHLFNGEGVLRKLLIDLREHEGINGSHTISEHVGKSDAFLRMRMRGIVQPNQTHYKYAHSTFSSLSSANKLVSSTLSTNLGEIADFLANPNDHKLSLTAGPFSSPTGRVAYRKGAGMFFWKPGPVQIRKAYRVRVVIRKNPSMPYGFNVHTAFPG
jgi:hypothetical protein